MFIGQFRKSSYRLGVMVQEHALGMVWERMRLKSLMNSRLRGAVSYFIKIPSLLKLSYSIRIVSRSL
jgi:hypothetical protein